MKDLGRIGVIVAARMGSVRLPGKALKPLQGIPMLGFLLRRLQSSRYADEIILATSQRADDDVLADLAIREEVAVHRGELEDVTARYIGAAAKYNIDTVVRVTGDCPFVDGELTDYCLNAASISGSFDLCTTKGRFPIGLDVEIYRNDVMVQLHRGNELSVEQREHLTLYLYHNRDKFRLVEISPQREWVGADGTYTIDTVEDYAKAVAWAAGFDTPLFTVAQLMALERVSGT